MKNKLLYGLIAVLVLFNVVSIVSNFNNGQSLAAIQSKVDAAPQEPIVYVGKDGKTPQAGIDYQLPKNGKDGVNAVSFVTTETIIKEIALVGPQGPRGIDGATAAQQLIRVNDDTKNIESKLTSEKYWTTLVLCADYRLVCPDAN